MLSVYSKLCRLAVLAVSLSVFSVMGAEAPALKAPAAFYADMQTDPWTLRQLADQGDATSAFLLGTRYASGRGGIRDDSLAVKWFARAAELGLPEAQYNLALMYATGRGVLRDMDSALSWVRTAAEQQFPRAQADLGLLYMAGKVFPPDPLEAARWLHDAAEQGEERAQYHLGRLYETSREVGLNAARALAWYERSASLGYPPAVKRLATLKKKLGLKAGVKKPSAASKSSSVAAKATPKPMPNAPRRTAFPPGTFTIQLANHNSRDSASDAMVELQLGRSAWIVETKSKSKHGFVILYGAYKTREDADKAVDGLPAKIRKAGTWVRAVAEVRKQAVK
jgi:TPR repeat protein